MTKKFVLNIVLNLGIVFLVLSAWAGYNSGQVLYLGISIALLVVLIYLKIVLLKQVSREAQARQVEKARESAAKKYQKKNRK
ncbi:MAG TPA: sortase [Candidatus Sphingobacterium stercorigallinarum]|nr:sortase [Candidatus Sphingobacterium stercorigallinarum]